MGTLALDGGTPVRESAFPAYPLYGEEEEQAAVRVVRSNALCAEVGHETATFEKEFAAYCGASDAVAVSNGTIALHVAIAGAGIGVGDEVIVPAYTFVGCGSAVVMQNAVPIFVDIETQTLGLDPDEVEKNITQRTKAIMPVHMNGFPCDMDAVLEIANKHDLVVIEDCSHAHGATYQGKTVGTLGHAGVFSFQHKKNMSLGEGGIVITSDESYARKIRHLHSFNKESPMCYNYRLPELQAAIGRERLKKLDDMNAVRRENAAVLDQELENIQGMEPVVPRQSTTPVYYNYVLRYSEETFGISRDTFLDALKAEGVPFSCTYMPLNHFGIFTHQNAFGQECPFGCPLYAGNVDYAEEDYPETAETCYAKNLEFKVHPPRTESDMLDVATAVKKVVDNIGELKQHGNG